MDNTVIFSRYLAQLPKDRKVTADDVRQAIKATGNVSPVLSFILSEAQTIHGINTEKELADLAQENARDTAAREAATIEQKSKADIKAVSSLIDKIAATIDTATPDEIAKAHEEIKALAAGLTTTGKAAAVITSKALMEKCKDYPPLSWIIQDFLGPGLTILSGAPKIGKSWLVLALAEAVSCGGGFLGQLRAVKNKVLYLALEDTDRRIYERGKSLGFSWNENLFITTQWDGGAAGLEIYLRGNPEIKLVIIDTLGRFMPEIEDMSDYAKTVNPMATIKKIADSLSVSILVIHHAKKGSSSNESRGDWMDKSLGSQGIVGSADSIFILERDIEKTGERKSTGKLYATGRDIRDHYFPVKFDSDIGTWAIVQNDKTPTPVTDTKKKAKEKKEEPDNGRMGWAK